ncbi:DUF3800 domain-containing protein [Rahnella sp. EDr1-12]|uniref:DUF3800 domain-containing protein n=1 Tax=unclassified Rahnella TaxID=2635087 RepID=UPI003BAC752B
MNYYLDESGNTGDLINKKNDMGFAKQPIFSHSCIGIEDINLPNLTDFIIDLKRRYQIDEKLELKSQDHYIKNPYLVFEIIEYIVDNDLPIICEVMDKKYNVAVSIVNHLIVPPMEDESDGKSQYIRTIVSDFITRKAPDSCYTSFLKLCKIPNEENLISTIEDLKGFFISEKDSIDDDGNTVKMLDATIDEYYTLKELSDDKEIINKYVPIPDSDSNGNVVRLLPNVLSFYNQIARLNKIHSKKLSEVELYHDTSSEFADPLRYCIQNIKNIDADLMPQVSACDYNVTEDLSLFFIDSKESIGVQIADIIAGFLNRYVYGLLYKEIEMDIIYHLTFNKLMDFNRTNDSLGTNFVLPISKREIIFSEFEL